LPQVFDPEAGWILSANHRPVGSFYQIPLGISTGSMGDTLRSWRLRERLQALPRFTPAQVLDIHKDAVNPARRNIVRLGLHLRGAAPGGLSPEATNALAVLEPWLKNGASSDLNATGAQLAMRISTFFRFTATPLTFRFGGGESGLARFLKAADAEIAANPKSEFDEEVWEFIDTVLANAWEDYQSGPTTTPRPKLGWFDSLDGFGSLDESGDLRQAEITVLDGQTIHSQAAQSYTQWVPLDNVDAAQTICPIGHSDRQGSPYRTSTMKLWEEAELQSAPLSRAAVDLIATERSVLSK
jgi:acyl-homoserine lactone acylase PvdQ